MPNPSNPDKADAERRERRDRVRAVLLSPDLLIGLPAGLLLGLLPAFLPVLLPNGFAFFITLAGISAAVAALVLTPMTMILGALTPTMKLLLNRVPGGPAGTLVPFAQVSIVAAVACVMSLVVALLTPLAAHTFGWVIWLATGLPIGVFLWALIGCVQVTLFLIHMFKQAQRAEDLMTRQQAARDQMGRAAS
jgi:MFS family permease